MSTGIIFKVQCNNTSNPEAQQWIYKGTSKQNYLHALNSKMNSITMDKKNTLNTVDSEIYNIIQLEIIQGL